MAAYAGRISETAFIGATGALLGVCIIACFIRFYIRIRVQKEFGWDDGFVIFGLCCLISGMGLVYHGVDSMYISEAVLYQPGFIPPDNLIPMSAYFRKIVGADLVLLWFAICSVKFSFLVLFRRLIRQRPAMLNYWWFTVAFNVVITVYGALAYTVTCPYFKEKDITKAFGCLQGSGFRKTLDYSISHMLLDIASDILILVIPGILIWQIRVRLAQKLALFFTLCLTVVMIIITALRIIGLRYKGNLDTVWEVFFVAAAAEVGLTLVAVSAFRSLFVAKARDHQVQETITTFNWYFRGQSALLRAISQITGRPVSDESEKERAPKINNKIPRAKMTGVQSFINKQGQTRAEESEV